MLKNNFSGRLFSKTAILLAIVGFLTGKVLAKEGMWLPPNLARQAAEMQAAGLGIPVTELFNNEGTGLNNAVVLFGKGCTGEIISSQGLVLTNHHCGYGSVQGLSNLDHDYFATGFWAMNQKEELPCPGLTVTFVRKMENVTDRILYQIPDTMDDASRDKIIQVRIKGLEKGYRYTSKLDAKIEPFYNGNQYWVILTETFSDIRLVGFPPNSIGFFGGDTDNWMWPRHNGDFSLFRVYAGKNNEPAAYNKDNKPYKPKRFFSIKTSGYAEGDFTMVYGFPGTTQEYISSPQLKQIYKISDPIRIQVRTKKLDVWSQAMNADRDVFIKYTSKRASIANGWKKWQGEVRGLKLNNVMQRKEEFEKGFQYWASEDTTTPYADNLLPQMQAVSGIANKALRTDEYIKEAVLGIELIQQGALLDKLLNLYRSNKKSEKELTDALAAINAQETSFLKNYDPALDQKLFTELMPIFMKECPEYVPSLFDFSLKASGGSYSNWARSIYNRSVLTSALAWSNLKEVASDTIIIKQDPAWQLYDAISTLKARRISPVLSNYYRRMARLNRLYLAARMRKNPDYPFYPDANLTLRLTYGQVKGIDPDGPAGYSYQTNIDQIIAKENPEIDEFKVSEKMKALFANKDYGRWGIPNNPAPVMGPVPVPAPDTKTEAKTVNQTLPVAFIADNHTSGGNSGSPVLNSKGELIGTNFDRIWEGTMSDLYFDPALCRNISVDVRYTLWVIEKFGGAGWLLKEMKLVK